MRPTPAARPTRRVDWTSTSWHCLPRCGGIPCPPSPRLDDSFAERFPPVMRISLKLALALSMIAAPLPAAARLTPAETRMVQTVDAEQERTVAMLEKWVNQNSGTLNAEGVRKVGDMVRAELEPLGFKVEWIDMSAAGRSGHLVARHPGKGKKMLLIGHLDTVFEPDSPFQRW